MPPGSLFLEINLKQLHDDLNDSIKKIYEFDDLISESLNGLHPQEMVVGHQAGIIAEGSKLVEIKNKIVQKLSEYKKTKQEAEQFIKEMEDDKRKLIDMEPKPEYFDEWTLSNFDSIISEAKRRMDRLTTTADNLTDLVQIVTTIIDSIFKEISDHIGAIKLHRPPRPRLIGIRHTF